MWWSAVHQGDAGRHLHGMDLSRGDGRVGPAGRHVGLTLSRHGGQRGVVRSSQSSFHCTDTRAPHGQGERLAPILPSLVRQNECQAAFQLGDSVSSESSNSTGTHCFFVMSHSTILGSRYFHFNSRHCVNNLIIYCAHNTQSSSAQVQMKKKEQAQLLTTVPHRKEPRSNQAQVVQSQRCILF